MIFEQNIINGNRKVAYSRRLVLANDDPVVFNLLLENEVPIIFKFVFETTEDKKANIRFKNNAIESGFEIEVVASNFNNPFGTGTINPVSFLKKTNNETKIEKEFSFTFYAYKNNDAHRILDLTIYEEI